MRKRRGVDLAPRLGVGGADPDEQADQADDDAAETCSGVLTGDPTKLVRVLARIKADRVHIPAFMADSSAIRAFSLGWSRTPAV